MESSVPKIGAMGGGGGVDGVCLLHLAVGFLPDPGSWESIGNDERERSKAKENGEAYAILTADNATATIACRRRLRR